jgi:hypothetical protein
MIVRKVVFDDIPALVDLGRRAHEASGNARFAFDEPGAKLMGAAAITQKTMCAFAAVDGEKFVGIVLGQEDKIPYAKMRYATDLVFYAEKPGAGKALMDRFTQWAFEERRVQQLLLGVSFGGKSARSAGAFYKRMGFAAVGGLYVKNRSES